MKRIYKTLFALVALSAMSQSLAVAGEVCLITYADGRPGGGIRQCADKPHKCDSPGGIFVFDQKLLAEDAESVIGRNAGFCILTDPGTPGHSDADNQDNSYSQCTWTLVFQEGSGWAGTIVVSGREAALGTSVLPVTGGTGDFCGAVGTLTTTPIPQGDDGVLFRQELTLSRLSKQQQCRKSP